jgi:hypothetical protein
MGCIAFLSKREMYNNIIRSVFFLQIVADSCINSQNIGDKGDKDEVVFSFGFNVFLRFSKLCYGRNRK